MSLQVQDSDDMASPARGAEFMLTRVFAHVVYDNLEGKQFAGCFNEYRYEIMSFSVWINVPCRVLQLATSWFLDLEGLVGTVKATKHRSRDVFVTE